MVGESAIIKILLDALKVAFQGIRKRSSKKRYAELLSGAIAEILREHPDVSAVEAKIAAAELTGQPPSSELFRAKKLLSTSKSWETTKVYSTILNQGRPGAKAISAADFFRGSPKKTVIHCTQKEPYPTQTQGAESLTVRWKPRAAHLVGLTPRIRLARGQRCLRNAR
jgi:hypothetical protein